MTKWQRIHLQCRRLKRHGFNPRIRKIPWRRKWQSTPVFLPGKFHGQRSLVGYSPWDCKELDTTEQLSMHAPSLDSSLASIDITGIPVCKSDKKTKRKKKKNYHVALGPSTLSTWKAFHAFIWSHSTICWKFLSQGLRSRPISPDMATALCFLFLKPADLVYQLDMRFMSNAVQFFYPPCHQ